MTVHLAIVNAFEVSPESKAFHLSEEIWVIGECVLEGAMPLARLPHENASRFFHYLRFDDCARSRRLGRRPGAQFGTGMSPSGKALLMVLEISHAKFDAVPKARAVIPGMSFHLHCEISWKGGNGLGAGQHEDPIKR